MAIRRCIAVSKERIITAPLKIVLYVHHANDMYGADISLLHSLTTLDRKAFYPVVILPQDMPSGMLAPELGRLGIEYSFVQLGILRRKYLTLRSALPFLMDFIKGVALVRSMVRRRGISVVYVNTIVAASGALGGKLAGVPVLWHVHEMLSYSRPVRWVLLRFLQSCAARILCVSRAVQHSLTADRPSLERKCTVLYNAVPAAQDDGETGEDLRQELQVKPQAYLVGMVGRITHWKGQEVLARAAALILQQRPHAYFVAAGSYFADESHYLDRVNAIIDELGLRERFKLLDYRSDVNKVYRSLDVFVLPSVKPEPFGRVTVEAMMQGCCVVATNHGGSPELIQDGVTGLLIEPGNPEVLADTVSRLLGDAPLRKRLGESAAVYAREHFSLAAYGAAINAVLEQLIHTRR